MNYNDRIAWAATRAWVNEAIPDLARNIGSIAGQINKSLGDKSKQSWGWLGRRPRSISQQFWQDASLGLSPLLQSIETRDFQNSLIDAYENAIQAKNFEAVQGAIMSDELNRRRGLAIQNRPYVVPNSQFYETQRPEYSPIPSNILTGRPQMFLTPGRPPMFNIDSNPISYHNHYLDD